jgi:hypothetical protein
MMRRALLLVRIAVAMLGLAVIGTSAADAGSFGFNYDKYLPGSVRSKIEEYVDKGDARERHTRAPAPRPTMPTPAPAVAQRTQPKSTPGADGDGL